MSHRSVIAEQRELWSTNPRDWAEIAEPENRKLFDELLDLTGVGAGTRFLDIACGSGYAAALAAARRAEVTGVDIAPALLEIARERTPDATFIEGEMDALPVPDSQFDVVTSVNGFQFALDAGQAFAEAARVLAPAGGARAIRVAGEGRVREALVAAIEPFRDRSGAISIHNVFRYVVGVRA